MTRKRLFVFVLMNLLALALSNARAQNISKAEYFFNTDPGQGNGINIPITPNANVNFTANIPLGALPSGFHILGLRVKENGGIWSLFESRGFYITTASTSTANISKAEYFIDTDPGQGNGTPITVSTGANVNFTFSVPTTSLSAGFHFLAIRVRDLTGIWSLFESRGFFITTSTTNVTNIVAAEYFYDTDPGHGGGIPLAVSSGATVNFTVPLPVGGLPAGFHFLGVRVKAQGGTWGIFESRGFYISGSVTNAGAVASAEYFYDTDPGPGNGTALSVPGGDVSNFTVDLPVGGLTPGFHFLTIRIKDSFGRWGQFETRGFYVYENAAAIGDIVAAEYFIDADPGQGLGIQAEVTTPALNINQVFPLLISGVTPGVHKLGFRVRDSEGVWSEPKVEDITILNCTQPSPPVVVSASRCNAGTVELMAAGATSGQLYKWYEQQFSGTSVFTGDKFTTPSITATTDYFVSIVDPVTTCESNRVKATATVVSFTVAPSITVAGSATLCSESFTILSAPAGFSGYQWSNGETTQSIIVRDGGTFTVMVSNGPDCLSPVSAAVTIVQTGQPCVGGGGGGNPNNIPPEIEHASMSTALRGKATLDLVPLISDHDGAEDIVLSSLKITGMPESGAASSIDLAGVLTVDYNQTDFSGTEFITIQVCDLSASCTQQDIDITVAGDITPFNALSPNGDGMNESLYLEFIEIIPETKDNKVTIFNRWGSPVFEITNYNNNDRVFKGLDQGGRELPNGTYFYRVEFGSGKKARDGFITLRR